MAKIFSESEKILQAKFSRGNSFSYDGEKHTIVNSGKATTATGECVTDLYIETVNLKGKKEEFKLSLKMDNFAFVVNKTSLERATDLLGPQAQNIIKATSLSIKNKFQTRKLTGYKNQQLDRLTLGWKIEIFKDTKRKLRADPNFTNEQKISIWSGNKLPKEKANAYVNGTKIKDAGIANFILVVPSDINDLKQLNMQYFISELQNIEYYAKKTYINYGFTAINYFVQKEKWDGNRPLAVWVDWAIKNNEILPTLIFNNPLAIGADEVAEKVIKLLKFQDHKY